MAGCLLDNTHRHEQQHQKPSHHIPRRVPPKGPLRLKRPMQTRPRDTQHRVKKPCRRRRQAHPQRPHIQRVRLRRVRERHGALARTVHDAKQVDAQRYASNAGVGVGGDPEGESGEEEGEGHQGEGAEEEVAPAEGIDGVDGGDGKDEIYDAEAEGGGKGGLVGEA